MYQTYEFNLQQLQQINKQTSNMISIVLNQNVKVLFENSINSDTVKIAFIVNEHFENDNKNIRIKFWFQRVNDKKWSNEFNSGLTSVKTENWLLKMILNLRVEWIQLFKIQILFA